jgi:EAL domain-containing protein (putative c-di-GMP-specific phosphodiesterase class I)
MGCQQGQGFYFARPMTADALSASLLAPSAVAPSA